MIFSTVLTSSLGVTAAAESLGSLATVISEVGPLEIYSLADSRNLNRFSKNDFIFRLARNKETGIVYWARRGNLKNIVATVDDMGAISTPESTQNAMMLIADLPKICGRPLHKSNVIFIPNNFELQPAGDKWGIGPVLMEGEIKIDTTGKTPNKLLILKDYRNSL